MASLDEEVAASLREIVGVLTAAIKRLPPRRRNHDYVEECAGGH
jgi:hypothetical protein